MRIALHTLAVLLGVLLAVAPVLAERPEDERVCGGSPDGKIKWCITLKAPNVCGGPDEKWHWNTWVAVGSAPWHCRADLLKPPPQNPRIPASEQAA